MQEASGTEVSTCIKALLWYMLQTVRKMEIQNKYTVINNDKDQNHYS
jgi:hypothetical protein